MTSLVCSLVKCCSFWQLWKGILRVLHHWKDLLSHFTLLRSFQWAVPLQWSSLVEKQVIHSFEFHDSPTEKLNTGLWATTTGNPQNWVAISSNKLPKATFRSLYLIPSLFLLWCQTVDCVVPIHSPTLHQGVFMLDMRKQILQCWERCVGCFNNGKGSVETLQCFITAASTDGKCSLCKWHCMHAASPRRGAMNNVVSFDSPKLNTHSPQVMPLKMHCAIAKMSDTWIDCRITLYQNGVV